ncbi:MAG TPA: aldo/keto reductase [Candidatus Paceibacterota bacterium]|nr:aldo/keto reductase [Candidatus Paceibacterota bacterium]
MNYRTIGKTGITVSEIGFGAWGIGGETQDGANSYGKTDDAESKRALERAFELGITFYDTSNIYGYGHSEELLGEVFSKRRDKVVIAGKAGFTKHDGPHDLSPAYLRKCLEESLRRLKTDYIDVYQLHSPPISLIEEHPECVEELQKMKSEGKIRAIGISVKGPGDALPAIEKFGFESVQVNFNLIDQRALETGAFEAARKHGAGIIARTPLAFGFLTGAITDLHFPPHDHRSAWPERQLKLWADAPNAFAFLRKGKDWTPTQLALKFCISFNAVSAVIPGILHPSEAEQNAAASEGALLTKQEIDAAIEVYKTREFFDRSAVRKVA